MSTSISTLVEVFDGVSWHLYDNHIFPMLQSDDASDCKLACTPFSVNDSRIFAFIAGVRNYSAIPPIAAPRGFPPGHESISKFGFGGIKETVSRYPLNILEGHTKTFFTVSELLSFDYNARIEDREDPSGNRSPVPPGHGIVKTYKEFLPVQFFEHLEVLKSFTDPDKVRVIFSFES